MRGLSGALKGQICGWMVLAGIAGAAALSGTGTAPAARRGAATGPAVRIPLPPSTGASDIGSSEADAAGPELASDVLLLRQLSALALNPVQLRNVTQQLARLDAAERSFGDDSRQATRGIHEPLERVRAAMLYGQAPEPADLRAVNAALDRVQKAAAERDKIRQAVTAALRDQLNGTQIGRIRL